tara:strand:+ start:306 stop:452 length:147 start_codon:yes stop_codon:yes gene_type:complete
MNIGMPLIGVMWIFRVLLERPCAFHPLGPGGFPTLETGSSSDGEYSSI